MLLDSSEEQHGKSSNLVSVQVDVPTQRRPMQYANELLDGRSLISITFLFIKLYENHVLMFATVNGLKMIALST